MCVILVLLWGFCLCFLFVVEVLLSFCCCSFVVVVVGGGGGGGCCLGMRRGVFLVGWLVGAFFLRSFCMNVCGITSCSLCFLCGRQAPVERVGRESDACRCGA